MAPTTGTYTVTWRSGYIGGKATVRIGTLVADRIDSGAMTLKEAMSGLIGIQEKLPANKIQITKIIRKRGTGVGIGTPNSWQDK